MFCIKSLFMCVSLSLIATGCSTSLPSCDDRDVQALANKILGDSLIVKMLAIGNNEAPVVLQYPAEERHDEKRRICKAMIETFVGTQKIYYSVEWHDERKGVIWVEFMEGMGP